MSLTLPPKEFYFFWISLYILQLYIDYLFYAPKLWKRNDKTHKKIDESGAKMIDNLCLSDHSSKWNMDLYLAVDKEVEGLENIKLSGKFFSKVYEGEYQNTGTWTKDFEDYALKNNYKVKKQYMWYTICPKCAKKYGKNYTVILGELD